MQDNYHINDVYINNFEIKADKNVIYLHHLTEFIGEKIIITCN